MTRGCLLVTLVIGVLLAGGTTAAGYALTSPQVASASATWSSSFVRPVHRAVITQGFGCTWFSLEPVDPACPGGHWHSGVDLAAAMGTPVYATLAGVAHVYVSATGYGLHVVIDHGGGMSSLYSHLSGVAVVDGQVVATGQLIGAVGSTGNSSGPHLHFEIRRDGVPENPLQDLQLP